MAQQYAITYYYVTPEDDEKMTTFGDVSGDSLKTLVTQYIRGWIGRNRDYYLDLAKRDAQARELSSEQWVEIMLNQGVEGLPDYQHPIEVPDSPLKNIVLPTSGLLKHQLNYILLTEQNLALLRIGIFYDRDSAIGFVSRIIREQLQRNWEKLYLPQVEANQTKVWF
ncbi:transposase [Anabaena cylindrica UHCC 0172]|uniref:transposase n=1 Tax=Anabaena cylindrica TaxID=1165 RepID=UPI002B20BADF|nr:transposase [Anabaena cylindrica]MEA5554400.1 transposase [Anabaena cylindrica UHCC 0172]